MNSALGRLQQWYSCHCDGEWEHEHGVRIGTLDNPGWSVDVDLRETELLGKAFSEIRREAASGKPFTELRPEENDWLHARIENDVFKIDCAPHNLEKALSIFLNWAGA